VGDCLCSITPRGLSYVGLCCVVFEAVVCQVYRAYRASLCDCVSGRPLAANRLERSCWLFGLGLIVWLGEQMEGYWGTAMCCAEGPG
jgi:hypothetical protein